MNLMQLTYFDAVVSFGGVRGAAAKLHVSPQAISSSTRRLESELGVQLLERRGREVCPTAHGRAFALRAKTILKEMDALKGFGNDKWDGVSPDGHFRLYIPNLQGRGSLFDDEWYDRFIEENQDMHLDVWQQSSSSCLESLKLGISDAAVVLERGEGGSVQYKEIGEVDLVLLVSEEGVKSSCDGIDLGVLSSQILAMPLNFFSCYQALSRHKELDFASLRFRDVDTAYSAQREFLSQGGGLLALDNAELGKSCPSVSSIPLRSSRSVSISAYYAYASESWTDRHQTVYWSLLKSFQMARSRSDL